MRNAVIQGGIGDCVTVLADFADGSIDAVVTDPPYGLSKEPDIAEVLTHWLAGDDYTHTGSGFMGKTWDSFVPGPATWKEVYRVLKPGGHAVVFAGTRTMDLMGMSLRLAGFEVRDVLSWMYGQGFPKSMNVSKSIDKNGEDGSAWDGWGTALKPAYEPILLVRKPLRVDGKKATVAANVLTHGTGAINIDATRISTEEDLNGRAYAEVGGRDESSSLHGGSGMNVPGKTTGRSYEQPSGRWPANVLLSHTGDCEQAGVRSDRVGGGAKMSKTGDATVEFGGGYDQGDGWTGGEVQTAVWDCVDGCPVRLLDEQSGIQINLKARTQSKDDEGYGGQGGASRFFYNAKASKSERNAGLPKEDYPKGNPHPTVKPVEVMRWLIRMVTPPGGVVLDPFCGSGTTLVAAVHEGVDAKGIDLDEDYMTIARLRVAAARAQIEETP